MQYLVISDIHSNWEGLQAVLADAAGNYDEIVCCGDLVGYGADPNRVTDWVRSNVSAVIRGNHDKACTGSPEVEWFNPAAKTSALWTMDELTDTNRTYLQELPQGPEPVAEFQILHGSPVDEDEYITGPYEAAEIAAYLDTTISFFGHTHLQGGFQFLRNGIRQLGPVADEDMEEVIQIEPDRNYMINPGSVGQPRDGDPRAAYALYDPQRRLITLRRVRYDIREAQRKIIAAGLPEILAMRLSVGQ